MKKTLFLISLWLVFSGVGALRVVGQANQFEHWEAPESPVRYADIGLEEALKQAKKEGKMVFVNIFKYQYAACRHMAMRTLTNDTIGQYINDHFIPIKSNFISEKEEDKALRERYQVGDWVFLFLDPDGHVKYSIGGGGTAYNVAHFLGYMEYAWSVKDSNPKDGVQFVHGSLEEVLAQAAEEKKLVFVDCYTKWCVPCAAMTNQVFPLKKMGDFFQPRFVSMKMDMETPAGVKVKERYDVSVYPTFLILDVSGNEIGRVVGGAEADPFIEAVKEKLTK